MTEITFTELMKELDKYEKPFHHKCIGFTEEQLIFIKKAREKKLSWSEICERWNSVKNWRKEKNSETLYKRYFRYLKNNS